MSDFGSTNPAAGQAPASPAATLTPAAVQQMINQSLAAQLAQLRTSGLIQTASTPASNQFVTDPFKMDFNPADKQGLVLYNKAT